MFSSSLYFQMLADYPNHTPGRRKLWSQYSLGTEQVARFYHELLRNRNIITVLKDDNLLTDKPTFAGSEETKTGYVLTTKSLRILTAEEACEVADIDMDKFEIEKVIVNPWETTLSAKTSGTGRAETFTNYQVKVFLKRKQPSVLGLESLIKDIIPTTVKYTYKPVKEPHMLELALYDNHFGMLAWEKETGNDYDLEIAKGRYINAVKSLLDLTVGFGVEKILLPIGNDFFHINSAKFETPRSGNQLDVDSRLPKIFKAGYKAVIESVDMCLQVAPIEMIWVPGNHDPETSYYLCEYLSAYYRNNSDVTISNDLKARKYIQYGKNLIGYSHGVLENKVSLPLIMATEVPVMWADTEYREFHIGHKHGKNEIQFTAVSTHNGVSVRTIPSLASADVYHYEKGFISKNKAAEAYLYHADKGLRGQFTEYING